MTRSCLGRSLAPEHPSCCYPPAVLPVVVVIALGTLSTAILVGVLVALVVFGPKRLPEIGKTLGRSLQEFRRASNDLREELQRGINEEPSAGDSAPPGTPN